MTNAHHGIVQQDKVVGKHSNVVLKSFVRDVIIVMGSNTRQIFLEDRNANIFEIISGSDATRGLVSNGCGHARIRLAYLNMRI